MFFKYFFQNVFVFSIKKLASKKTCRLPQLSFPPGTCERSRGRAPPEGNGTPKCPQKNSELTKCFQTFRLTTCSKTMSRFPFVFPCNFLYAGSMLYALCSMQCGGQKTALLWPLQPLQPLHFERFCRVLLLSFSIFISSFLYFFIMSELDFWDSSAVWSSLDQPPLGPSTTCSANSILPVPVAPSTTWCGKAKIEFMSGEFLKMGRNDLQSVWSPHSHLPICS